MLTPFVSMAYRLKNLRVLVIDHNLTVRLLLRSLLLDLGFGIVDMAANTDEGWSLYLEHRPDVILVDWRLDKNDGIDFVRRVRIDAQSPTPDVSIIMMTSHTNKERLFQARDSGVTEFLIKPFTIDTLTKHFTHLIEKPRDFVRAPKFTGPDRRRRLDGTPDERRNGKKDS